MARETVAQRNARFAQEREARLAQEVTEYPQRLMKALEEATQKNNYELTVQANEFVLFDRDRPRNPSSALTMAHTLTSQLELEKLEYDIESKAEERAEHERRYEVKQAALAKLTKEERELLNLQ